MTPLLAAMLAALTLNPHAQTPTQPPTAPAPTGVIRGHVLSADGRPLRDANVSLLPSGGGFVRTAHTDEDGSYQFSDLPAGGYRVTASHSGFSSLSFGQRSASDWGAPFVLRAGEVREHVDIVLPRHSAIVGHVTDENGDPLEGVNVSVLKIGFTAGRRQLVPSGAPSQRTNDQGRFRVYGLQPGAYVIGADTGQVGREVLPGYATTYFPGTPNASAAQTVAVGLSQDVMDVNFSLVPVRTVRVSGRTVASDGEPFQGGVEMRVSRRSSAVASGSFGARTESDGSFEFPNVPPGEYVIGAFKSQEVGWQIVAVSDADVTGLVVPTSPGSTVTGRVTFDGANPPERSSVNVAFVPADPDFVPFKGQTPQVDMRSDGTFEMRFLNGLGRLRVTSIPAGWALKSIVVNGADVTDTPLPFGTKAQSLKDVGVVLTNQLTQVTGTLADANGRPFAGAASLLIFSTDRDRWYDGSRFFLFANSRGGAFVRYGLPAGEYFIVAVDWLQLAEMAGGWQDPALLESLARRATRVTLSDGQTTTVSLRLVPR